MIDMKRVMLRQKVDILNNVIKVLIKYISTKNL